MALSSSELPVISGYRIIEKIYSSSQTLIYRAIREKDQKSVVIKLMQKEYPTSQEIAQFRNQYFISKNLNTPHIVKSYSLEKYGQSYAFIMEDFGGISLRDEINRWNDDKTLRKENFLIDFLNISIQLVSALDDLYNHQIIHKDIKPDNILINPQTKEVKITDFSISTILPREIKFITNSDVLEGSIAYISPEQTGRMNRGIDYRTDYYSLGVTLFEMLTGKLPFNKDNPLELIYCHIAKKPPTQKIIHYGIPSIISEIVGKLMAKNAENRYQSAFGLKSDLEVCLNDLKIKKSIVNFELGSKDISDHFSIPEKLYGRQVEVQELLDIFDRVINPPQHHLIKEQKVRKGVEIVLVKGASGLGKTAVVNEIHKPILKENGYFIKGKFDQLQRDIPFSGWVEALSNLIRQLLSESEIQIQQWKSDILSNLGDQSQVIIDLIPELELILGAQPKATDLSGIAAQHRLNFLFHKFIRIFAVRKHPLVIFLDDLQWADTASLHLIQLLMSEDHILNNPAVTNSTQLSRFKLGIQMPNFNPTNLNENDNALLLIGSYRDNEIDTSHSLNITIREIQKQNVKVSSILLEPLNQADLGFLISDTLKCEVNHLISLTQVIFAKTKGNPFFIHQFIKTLYKDKVIKFNYKIGRWECDIANARKFALTDDVVEFMADQIKRLPIYNQKVLKYAACIGNQFDLQTLAKVHDKHPNDTITDLWDSVLEGLVVALGKDAYQLNQNERTTVLIIDSDETKKIALGNCKSSKFKFIHDRVQQAAYSLIPEAEKKQIHLQLGQLLLNKTSAESWEEDIFEIVNQFDKALELVTIQKERNELAKMNLIAGKKALSSTAYQAALKYLNTGKYLITSDCWKTEYELSLGLYEALAEVTYLTGDFHASDDYIDVVLAEAKTLLEKIKVYEIRIQAYTSQNKLIEAINISRGILSELGVTFPANPTQEDIQKGLIETCVLLEDKNIDELANLPSINDVNKLAIMRIASRMSPPAYIADQLLFPLIILSQVNLSINYGNSPISAFCYGCYGILLSGILNDVESADKFGKLALKLVEKFYCKEIKARIFFIFGTFIAHVKSHIKEALPFLVDSYQTALEIGSLDYVGYCAQNICKNSYFLGENLSECEKNTLAYIKILESLKQLNTSNYCKIFRQSALNLQYKQENFGDLSSEAYDENKSLSLMIETNDICGLHYLYLNKLILLYYFEEYEQAQDNGNKCKLYLAGGVGFISIPYFYFYESLIALSLYFEQCSEQDNLLALVRENQEKLKQWAHHAPMNYLHKFYLVEAEINRVLGNYLEAIEAYESAIAIAKENEYLHEEALANELAAKFYLKWGKQKIAKAYLNDAYYGYIRWGATAKVKDLQKRYPQLLTQIVLQDETYSNSDSDDKVSTNEEPNEAIPISVASSIKTMSASTQTISKFLDFESVIQASQAISEQIKLEELLPKLMEVIMENAGASKCALILSKNLDLELTAISYNSDISSMFTKLPYIPLETSEDVPVRLINYVKRTQETRVIDDANTQNYLAADSYIIREKPKSILCIPIMHQCNFFGILYLENKLTVAAFTQNRIKLLKLIINQAAISLQNATLYNELVEAKEDLENSNTRLEQKVAERTQEINNKNQTLKQALVKLQNTQAQLIQTEKMSSLGQMIAGIAHEINNPVSFIHGNINHLRRYVKDLLDIVTTYQQEYDNPNSIVTDKFEEIDLDFLLEDLPKILTSVEIGTSRISNIILGLRNFSRLDEAEIKSVDIHEGIDNSFMILQYRLEPKDNYPEIRIIKEYGQLPHVNCYPSQLNQVFMNILCNAIDALKNSQIQHQIIENPTIHVSTELVDSNTVKIRISDNASGIEEKVKQKIFDPFFTTKPVGSGTGLGLSISYQIIVEKHKGQLICNSILGKGTEFVIEIPV